MAWTSELANENDSLPTIKQWMKSVSREALDCTFILKIVWLPNLYPNISLDTEAFRVRLSPGNFLFDVVQQNIEDWIDNDRVIGIQIESRIPLKLTLLELEKDCASWDELGEHGYKIGKVSARTKKNVTGKTRSKVSSETTASEQPPEAASE
jgi:hypothetical protein